MKYTLFLLVIFVICFSQGLTQDSYKVLRKDVGIITRVEFSPDGNILASANWEKVDFWDINKRKLIRSLTEPEVIHEENEVIIRSPKNVLSICFSPDGKYFAAGQMNNKLMIWRVIDGKLIYSLEDHGYQVRSISFNLNNRIIASTTIGSAIWIWRLHDGALLRTLWGHVAGTSMIKFSPIDSNILISSSFDGEIILWNMEEVLNKKAKHSDSSIVFDSSLGKKFKISSEGIISFDISPDGKYITTVLDNGTAIVLQLDQQEPIKILEVDSDFISTLEYNPNFKTLVTGTEKGEIIIWRLEDWSILNKLFSFCSETEILSLAYSPNGEILACAVGSNAILYWDLNK